MGSRSSGVPASVYETTHPSCSRTRDFDSLHVPSHKRRSGMSVEGESGGVSVWRVSEGVCVCAKTNQRTLMVLTTTSSINHRTNFSKSCGSGGCGLP